MDARFRRWSGNALWTWPTRGFGPATSPGSSASATAASARSWDGKHINKHLARLPVTVHRPVRVLWPLKSLLTYPGHFKVCLTANWLHFKVKVLCAQSPLTPPSLLPLLPVTTRQAASSPAWSAAPSPRWPPRKSWTKSQSTRGRIPPCSPGRSGTGCWRRECVTATRCPAWAPLTGDKLNYEWNRIRGANMPLWLGSMWIRENSDTAASSNIDGNA